MTPTSSMTPAEAEAYRRGKAEGFEQARERAVKAARRGTNIARGWIEPGSHDERTDALLYSSLREGQEIESAIRAMAPPA